MLEALYSHLARRAAMYLWMLVAFVTFSRYFALTINVSNSLPGTIFLVEKGAKPGKGDLAAFRYNGGGPYERGSLFLKRVLGMPGSVVTATDRGNGYRDYFVDGQFAGRAKPLSKHGMPLAPGPVGVIPEGRYYMAAPNPDSLDSRYALVGWVKDSQIVGRGIKIF
ncbi:S26 family signal peptidase [Thiobacter aerophilum]|uniref:S26 family signal peptidase n=1 Tax=Thiobacter aerophilum TaxID=3121275 RepID=A0ABV0EG75_9BURK